MLREKKGKTSESTVCGSHWRPDSSDPSVDKRPIPQTRDWRKKEDDRGVEEEELVVMRRDEIYRSSVPADDDPMSASPTIFARSLLHFGGEEGHYRELQESLPSTKNGELSSRGISQAIIYRMSNSAEKEWPFIC